MAISSYTSESRRIVHSKLVLTCVGDVTSITLNPGATSVPAHSFFKVAKTDAFLVE